MKRPDLAGVAATWFFMFAGAVMTVIILWLIEAAFGIRLLEYIK